MSDVEYFFLCKECGTEAILSDHRNSEGIGSWSWDCPKCEEQIGWGYDGGTVDLGLVLDSQLGDSSDFQVFEGPMMGNGEFSPSPPEQWSRAFLEGA